jgi:hypothetical protein
MVESLINHDVGLKQMAHNLHCRLQDLLVLGSHNDPFHAGRPLTERKMAEWFANLWHHLGYTNQTGIHLRRIHYELISQEGGVLKHNGEPYFNTEKDWNYMTQAAKYARYLNLVDPKGFVDRRNPDPHDFSNDYPSFLSNPADEEPYWTVTGRGDFNDNDTGMYNDSAWQLPSIHPISFYDSYWNLPEFEVGGFNYNESLQPYHIEIWCEKSTMNDVIIPVCRKYGATLVTGLGFLSITAVIQLLDRIKRIGKPTRIFYVSDFDPKGDAMPTAVSRQIEYWLNFYNLDFDVKLSSIVLTKEQVKKYALPRVPIKDSDSCKKSFELKYGEGAVELDALESLHHGELARILTHKILEFRDENLENKIDNARKNFDSKITKIWGETIEPYQNDLEEIKEEIEPILKKYNDRIEELDNEMQLEIYPIKEKLKNIQEDVNSSIDDIEVDLPEKPHAEVPFHPGNGWLFDSKRDFLEQMKHYRQSGERAG